ncbi:DUF535 family protein [Hymenobacter baengnokdamensis]|uniref:DUF535 family protein n=1 Tax=Hymenobacter baengnokdamensis TaxID=2615203 RepID=UPI001E4F2CB1|nr:DUF535 family protein [Hymenobacter baengnokdamensis]
MVTPALNQLLERQPRFLYKYLSRYIALSFSRTTRLAVLLNHYDFLTDFVGPGFFNLVASQPVIWQEQRGTDRFAISLSYPSVVGFEAELSLNLMSNGVLLQVVSFVIVPGRLVGATSRQAILISQVQGTAHQGRYRHATRALLDITPATLLVQAAYGLAAALHIDQTVGISTEEQLSFGTGSHFNYNAFWEQQEGIRTAANLFLLPLIPFQKPLDSIKSKHRARTLRKRHYKQALRQAVEQNCLTIFQQLRAEQSVSNTC